MRVATHFVLVATVVLPLAALAHGGGQHFMGVVKATAANGLTIETREKKEVRVVFDEKTKFENAGSPSSASDLTVGERVVVHTTKQDDTAVPTATLVRWGAKQKHSEHEAHELPSPR